MLAGGGAGMRRLVLGVVFHQQPAALTTVSKRQFWGYFVRDSFNTRDVERLKQVGADRLCAEWIVKNGGSVRFAGHGDFVRDYSQLAMVSDGAKVDAIDIRDADITENGFWHLEDVGLKELTVVGCKRVKDAAVGNVAKFTAQSLQLLHVENCPITDQSAVHIQQMGRLRRLFLKSDKIQNPKDVKAQLEKALPNCTVEV